MALPLVSVIVCTRDRAERLEVMLSSLVSVSPPATGEWEIVVVDNASSDRTPAVLAEFRRRSPVALRSVVESRVGLCHARNTGVEHARAPLLVFTDDDVTIAPEWLAETVNAFERFDCAGVAGRILPVWEEPEPPWHRTHGPYALMAAIVAFDHGEDTIALDTPGFGANMAFRRRAFESYGGFRTDLGRVGKTLLSGEDTDFGRRLLAAGEKIIYAPRAVVWHPVERHRATRRYFRKWYFHYGRSLVRRGLACAGASAPVPPYLLRQLASSCVRGVFSADSAARLYHRLTACQLSGQLIESLRQSWNR